MTAVASRRRAPEACVRAMHLAAVALVAASSAAGAARAAEPSAAQPGPPASARARIELRRLARVPSVNEFAGMEPPADLRDQLVRVSGFLQRTPTNGAPAARRTDVYLGRDDDNMYAVFVCFTEPGEGVRAHFGARDHIADQDAVALELDTFRDERRAYVFRSNPVGVQADGVWIEGSGLDTSFDLSWDSAGILTDRGFVVFMRIPFQSMRFPPAVEVQRWGVMLARETPRAGELSYWPRYSTQGEGRLDQMGELDVPSAVPQGRLWRAIPYAALRSSRALDLRDPAVPRFAENPAQPSGGVDAKLVLRESLVVDLTANPDFSQAEPDEPLLTANARFELRRPEKRPFFLENASYFDTPIPVFFTRRIVRPTLGARLTGKLGAFDVGVLAIDDAAPDEPLAHPLEPSVPRARDGVVRVSYDLGRQSSLGGIYVVREQSGDYQQVGGVDGRLKLSDNWVAQLQLLGSRGTEAGTVMEGSAASFTLRERGTHTSYDLTYGDRSPEFRAVLGFVPRVGYRSLSQTAELQIRPAKGPIVAYGPRSYLGATWDHAGTMLGWISSYFLWCQLPHGTRVEAYFEHWGERLRPVDLPGLESNVYNGVHDVGVSLSSELSSYASIVADVFWGTFPNRHPLAGQRPEAERSRIGSLSLTLRLTRHLTAEASYEQARLAAGGGDRIHANDALWSRVTYQFTPRLSVKALFQLARLSANPARSSLTSSRFLGGLVLLTYQLRLGTELLLGYQARWQDPDPRATIPALGMPGAGYLNTEDMGFLKLSYLLGS